MFDPQRDRSPDLRLNLRRLPALGQWLAGKSNRRRLQLRGSADSHRFPEHRVAITAADGRQGTFADSYPGFPNEAGTPKMGIWPVS